MARPDRFGKMLRYSSLMRILFYHPFVRQRTAELSYDNMVKGGGFSGTETALLEAARCLRIAGNDVTIYGLNRTLFRDSCGIEHVPLNRLPRARLSALDWYCPMFYVADAHHLALLSALDPARTRVLVWLHCIVDPSGIERIKSLGYRVYAQYVSSFVAQRYAGIALDGSWTIGNGIDPRFFGASDCRVKGRWAFLASFERGGEMARMVFDRVRATAPEAASELHTASYWSHDTRPGCEFEVNHGSLSKRGVAKLLHSAEYFVYPLVLPSGAVHHDTFACVVLEALAAGVTVITWDVACLREVYGDHVTLVEPPAHEGYDARAPLSSNPDMRSEESVDALARAVLVNEDMSEEDRARKREAARGWALAQTWASRTEQMAHHLQM